ncbi:MAG: hypothetical protein HC923_01800 [Myxococcales bacterium]|nr:hypothetical protein [Myxococcales bacterium]
MLELDLLSVALEARPLRWLSTAAWVVFSFDAPRNLRAVYGGASAVQELRAQVDVQAPCACYRASVHAGTARDRASWDIGVSLELLGLGMAQSR